MNQSLTFDNKKFISAKQAAHLAGYTSDYVGQLCRGGKIEARMVGRSWFVSEQSILDHKVLNVRDSSSKIFKIISKDESGGSKNNFSSSKTEGESFLDPNKNIASSTRDAISFEPLNKAISGEQGKDGSQNYFGQDDLIPQPRKAPPSGFVPRARSSRLSHFDQVNPEMWLKVKTLGISVMFVFGTYAFAQSEYPGMALEKTSNALAEFGRASRVVLADMREVLSPASIEVSVKSVSGNLSLYADAGSRAIFSGFQSLYTSAGKTFKDISITSTDVLTALSSNPQEFFASVGNGIIEPVSSLSASAVSAFADGVKNSFNSFAVGVHDGINSLFGRVGNSLAEVFVPKNSSTEVVLAPAGKNSKPSLIVASSTTPILVVESLPDVPLAKVITMEGPRTIVEKVSERVVVGDITRAEVEQKLNQLNNALSSKIFSISSATASNASYINNVYNNVAAPTNRIDSLSKVTITSPTVSGGTFSSVGISGGTISGTTITGGTMSGTTISDATFSGTISAGTTTVTNLISSNTSTSTFAGGVSLGLLNVTSTSATSTIAGGLSVVGGGLKLSTVLNCNGVSTLDTDAEGNIVCGVDSSGGSATPWTSAIDAAGFALTNGGTFSFTNFVATSTTAFSTIASYLGIGTTSPASLLTVSATSSLSNRSILSVYAAPSAGATTTALTVLSNGNVGIGTSTPGSLLSISGIGNFTSATSTLYSTGGINLTSGCFAINSTCVGGAGGGSGTVNSGTAGYFSYYPSTGTTVDDQTILYTDGTNIGIGTSSPYAKLSVAGQVVGEYFTATSTTATSTIAGGLAIETSGFVYDHSTGYVGIGTAAPLKGLHVQQGGTASLTSAFGNGLMFSTNNDSGARIFLENLDAASNQKSLALVNELVNSVGTTYFGSLSDSGSSWVQNYILALVHSSGNVGIGESAPGSKLSVSGGATIGASYDTTVAPTNGFLVEGNVGIGTTSPYAKLSVVGEVVSAYFTATTTSTSTLTNFLFTNAQGTSLSASAASVTTLCLTGDTCRTTWPSGSGGANDTKFSTSSTDSLSIYAGGVSRTGFGTSSPLSVLTVSATSSLSNLSLFSIFAETSTGATTTALTVLSDSKIGIGTSSPYAKLSVVGQVVGEYFTATSTTATSTFSGGLNVGSGGLLYDFTSGITSIGTLETGSFNFDTDAGQVSWVDLPVSSTAVSGLIQSYSAQIAGTPILTIYGVAHGTTAQTVKDSLAVGIGTTTPLHALDIFAASSTIFTTGKTADFFGLRVDNRATSSTASIIKAGVAISNSGSWSGTGASNIGLYVYGSTGGTNNYDAIFNGGGNIGIGTTSPWRRLSVTGTVGFDGLTSSATGDAICITANKEITTASGASCLGVSSQRFKHDIVDLDLGLSTVLNLRPVGFLYNEGYGDSGTVQQFGLIAEEAYAVDPRLAVLDAGGLPTTVRYDFLAPLLIKSVQQIGRVIDLAGATTTSPAISIDSLGNVGVGTTSPLYKMTVDGDLAATSFVNISTSASKKDVAYVDEENKRSMLDKLRNIKVAEYRYNNEVGTAPLRLGLIAEEAPQEVLALGGKGVDIYKLATFILTGVQEQQKKIDNLELRVAHLESLVGSGGSSGGSLASVLSSLENLGAKIVDGVATFKNMIVDSLTVGSATKTSGITLYDEVTKEPYCLSIANGATKTVAGACGVVSAAPAAGAAGSGDTTPPVITVIGNNPAEVMKNNTYVDLGATVVDPAFGTTPENTNLSVYASGDVNTSTLGTYTIFYTAQDQAGNGATSTRTVIVYDPAIGTSTPSAPADTTAPVITINGSSLVSLEVGATYADLGASATDNVDGDITANIVVQNTVDTSVAGSYAVTYNVSDTAGNSASEVVRTVTVTAPVPPPAPSEPDPNTATSTPSS